MLVIGLQQGNFVSPLKTARNIRGSLHLASLVGRIVFFCWSTVARERRLVGFQEDVPATIRCGVWKYGGPPRRYSYRATFSNTIHRFSVFSESTCRVYLIFEDDFATWKCRAAPTGLPAKRSRCLPACVNWGDSSFPDCDPNM